MHYFFSDRIILSPYFVFQWHDNINFALANILSSIWKLALETAAVIALELIKGSFLSWFFSHLTMNNILPFQLWENLIKKEIQYKDIIYVLISLNYRLRYILWIFKFPISLRNLRVLHLSIYKLKNRAIRLCCTHARHSQTHIT